MITETPWINEKWFTSPWNFDEDVTKDITFAPKIKFHDVTLRDGEQQAGLIFNKDQKLAIADRLVELGVDRIEAGMPVVSPQDSQAVEEIVKRYGKQCDIFAFCRCVKDDVKRAADCGAKGIVIEIPSSEHMIKYAYKWTLERAVELSISSTDYAKELGLYTVFFPIDMTRADMDWVLTLLQKVATQGHMDAIALVDTLGGLSPHAVAKLVRATKEKLPGKPVEIHFHDDFGFGSANTLIALAAGADVAHTTICAAGERSGNTGYEDIALALRTMYNIETGIKLEKIYPTAKFFREISGMAVRPNRGIIGDDISKIESGIITDWYMNVEGTAHENEVAPYLPSLIGHPPTEVVIGKGSGIPNVEYKLRQLGQSPIDDKEIKTKIVAAIKEDALSKMRLLSDEEFLAIVKSVTSA
jgi:isopropylmalate/homocitrate/citramalate synthase